MNVGQTMVVDNFQNLCLFQTGYRLGSFVMVHQHHPFSPGTEQMVAGQYANDLFGFVQNGVTVFPEFQHLLFYIVHLILQMEANQIPGAADAADGSGLENQAGGPIGIIRGGYNASSGRQCSQFLVQFCLTQHQTVYIHFQRPPDHIRLMAA